jgi:hypothetical protein
VVHHLLEADVGVGVVIHIDFEVPKQASQNLNGFLVCAEQQGTGHN